MQQIFLCHSILGFQRSLLLCTKNFLLRKGKSLNTSQIVKSPPNWIHLKNMNAMKCYIEMLWYLIYFKNICHVLQEMYSSKERDCACWIIWWARLWLKEARDEFSFYPPIWEGKVDDAWKNSDGIRREKWFIERALIYSIGTCRSLFSKQLATLVLVHSHFV